MAKGYFAREPKIKTESQMAEVLKKRTSKPLEVAQSPKEKSLPNLDHELWLAGRLRQHGVDAFDGDTTPDVRRQRIRDAIRKHGLQCVIAGSRKGKPVNYPEAFELIYGEPL